MVLEYFLYLNRDSSINFYYFTKGLVAKDSILPHVFNYSLKIFVLCISLCIEAFF